MRIILNAVKKIIIFILLIPIRIYQYVISPVLQPSCRFVPSCSIYAIEALKIHGPLKGLILATWRILRCNPWGGHGYDPVPPKKKNIFR